MIIDKNELTYAFMSDVYGKDVFPYKRGSTRASNPNRDVVVNAFDWCVCCNEGVMADADLSTNGLR